jgi:hypothetical protein
MILLLVFGFVALVFLLAIIPLIESIGNGRTIGTMRQEINTREYPSKNERK